jgi:serine/threonine-protein kinase RsbW
VELRLPNRPEFVAVARLAVAAVATRMGFDIADIEDIKVAIGEACTNAIEHGCAGANTGMITLRCELGEDELVITVHDPGDGFDPTTASRQHRHGTMTLSERGLGMLLIESLMDASEVTCTPGNGTLVRMVKRVRATEAKER